MHTLIHIWFTNCIQFFSLRLNEILGRKNSPQKRRDPLKGHKAPGHNCVSLYCSSCCPLPATHDHVLSDNKTSHCSNYISLFYQVLCKESRIDHLTLRSACHCDRNFNFLYFHSSYSTNYEYHITLAIIVIWKASTFTVKENIIPLFCTSDFVLYKFVRHFIA